jgi:cationic amino acid transporter 1
MGLEEGGAMRALMRRKQVDSDRVRAAGGHQLAKELSVTQLVAIGPKLFS